MLAGLPKLFDKNFVIGFLLPVVLGLIAFAWLFPDIELLKPLRSLGANETSLAGLTYLVLASYGLALLLMMTNNSQYQLLEGYIGPLSRWRRGRAKHQARRTALAEELAGIDAAEAPSDADIERSGALGLQLVNDYPPLDQPTLPTRFGNAIRAFESYPLQAYGADGTPIWLRLTSVISAQFFAALEDARAQVNFLLNLLYLLPLVAIAALWKAAAETPWNGLSVAIRTGTLDGWHLLPSAIAGVVALLLIWPVYAFAIKRAKAWGDVVKAAFDCYLPALTEQLGYAPPATDAARTLFWQQINALIVYRQPLDPGTYRIIAPPIVAAETEAAPREDD